MHVDESARWLAIGQEYNGRVFPVNTPSILHAGWWVLRLSPSGSYEEQPPPGEPLGYLLALSH